MMDLPVSIIGTIIFSILLIAVMRHAAVRLALVDRPNARKRHDGVVPLCGGICIFTVFAVVLCLSGRPDLLNLTAWIGLAVIVITGMVDDLRELPAHLRLSLQFAASGLLINALPLVSMSFGTAYPVEAGTMLVAGSAAAIFLFAIVFVSGLMNAWNMLDGVDGLAGGLAAVALAWLVLFAAEAGDVEIILPIEILIAAIFGFLFFNMRNPFRKKAIVFLGDAGSTALGASIAYLMLRLSSGPDAIAFPILLWIVILPVTDTLSLIVRRTYARRSPMSADRWHMHHLLLDSGLSPSGTTLVLLTASGLCGGWGYIGHGLGLSDTVMTLGLLVPVALHSMFVGLAFRLRTVRARGLTPVFDVVPDSIASSVPVASHQNGASEWH